MRGAPGETPGYISCYTHYIILKQIDATRGSSSTYSCYYYENISHKKRDPKVSFDFSGSP